MLHGRKPERKEDRRTEGRWERRPSDQGMTPRMGGTGRKTDKQRKKGWGTKRRSTKKEDRAQKMGHKSLSHFSTKAIAERNTTQVFYYV